MFKDIYEELKNHAPFTLSGAMTGIVLMVFFYKLPTRISHTIFYIFHPLHVVLGAFVTTSMYQLHKYGRMGRKYNLWILLAIGYIGSVGIATFSDSLIPYLGEFLLGLPNREFHIGFIEKWYIINPLALMGIGIAYFRPATKVPHSAHILVSTWASLFHIVMALGQKINWYSCIVIFVFLFLAVWIPCCTSDIIFPLLFVKEKS